MAFEAGYSPRSIEGLGRQRTVIGIVDYGAGNLWSVVRALRYLGAEVCLIRSADDLQQKVDGLVLPGVGAFGWAVRQLQQRGLWNGLQNWLNAQRPFLGICLGMQLLMETSEESPGVRGLDVVRGVVRKFRARKVPQIGWNRVSFIQTITPYSAGSVEYFYFVHGYYVECMEFDVVAGVTEYGGVRYASALRKGRMLAVQFHPEKSGWAGLTLLRGWLEEAGNVQALSNKIAAVR